MQLTTSFDNRLVYERTNESLRAIVAGLDVKKGDDVLAICGSGDQALAMLSRGANVCVADVNPIQLAYFRRRLDLFLNKPIEDFVLNMGGSFAKYIGQEDLDMLRSRIGNVEILPPQDIFDNADIFSRYSKIYLSNSIGYMTGKASHDGDFAVVADNTRKGTLVYASERAHLLEGLMNESFSVREDLTEVASRIESEDVSMRTLLLGYWRPVVLERL